MTHTTDRVDRGAVGSPYARRAAMASFVGSTLEYYDFFIYASLSALAFNTLFFPGLGSFWGTLVSMATIGVGYDSDLEKVERVTIDVARGVMSRIEGAVTDFEPQVRFHTFAESSIQFNVILRYKEYGAQFLAQHELVKALHKRYREEGIEIPYPIRTVFTRGEARPR